MECSLDAHYLGNYEESKKLYELVLQKKDLPADIREGVQKNLQIADFMIGMDIKKNLTELVSSYDDKIIKLEALDEK